MLSSLPFVPWTGGHRWPPRGEGRPPGRVLVLAPVAMSAIEIHDYSARLWGRDIRTLYNINLRDAREFLRLVGEIRPSLGTEVFPNQTCQEAMIRVRQGRIRQANAAVRVVPS